MLKRLSNSVAGRYSCRSMIALLLGAAFFAWLFNYSTVPFSNPEMKRISNGEKLLDTRLNYSGQQAYSVMGRYGAEGRARYLRFLAADTVFALTYGLAFALLFTRLSAALFDVNSLWRKLNLLPLGIALADYVENGGLFFLLVSYPRPRVLIGTLAGIATLAKWLMTVVAFGSLTIAILLLIVRHCGCFRRRRCWLGTQ